MLHLVGVFVQLRRLVILANLERWALCDFARRSCVRFAATVLACVVVSSSIHAALGSDVNIPAIAHVGPVVVGVTTMEDLENELGKGLPSAGGHPHGARRWRLGRTEFWLEADGFDYNKSGRVSFSLDIYHVDRSDASGTVAPKAHIDLRRLALVGTVCIGASRTAALRALLSRKITISGTAANSITCNGIGHVMVNSETVYSSWSATIVFRHGKVFGLDVRCD